MGRGLSVKQKQILGLATLICDTHKLPVGRGDEILDGWRYNVTGRVMENCIAADIVQPLAVHHVWGIHISKRISRGVNPGHFDNSVPGVKSAKVSASKAIRALCNRDLLRDRKTKFFFNGYVLTEAGYAIGKDHQPSITSETIRLYLKEPGPLDHHTFPLIEHKSVSITNLGY